MPQTYDVIVIGAGGSGLAAGLSAAEQGGRVLVLEKQPQPGGTTGIAVGSFTAAGTRLQRKSHIEDNAADHAEDAGKFAPAEIEARNNEALRRYFLEHAAETLDWLEALGLSFVGPRPEPPNRVGRMHNVVPGAKAYIAALQLALQRVGGELVCDAAVTSIERNDGRVDRVTAKVNGQARQFTAQRGVILAAGDYANGRHIIREHKGDEYGDIEGINPFATGDGHQLALAAGAKLINMDVTYGPELRFVPPSRKPFQQVLPAGGWPAKAMGAIAPRLPKWVMRNIARRLLVTWQHPENALFDDGAILVNCFGSRFVNEKAWPDREQALARQPHKMAFILLDRRLTERYSAWPHFISTAPDIAYAYVSDYLKLRPDVTVRASTLAEIAECLSKLEIKENNSAGSWLNRILTSVAARPERVDELTAELKGGIRSKLGHTIDVYNQYAEGNSPDEFGRTGDEHPLDEGPYVLLGPVKAYFTTTEGGTAINERMQVLDESGSVIPGLYAVGQNGLGGMILWGHGLHIAWAMTSGRLAGKFIMEETSKPEA